MILEDWDLLVILDTCRVDALREVKEQTDAEWLSASDVGTKYSNGGSTLEWTAQTFSDAYLNEVSEINFVAGNMLVQEVLRGNRTPEDSARCPYAPTDWHIISPEDFNEFIPAWKYRETRGPDKGHIDRPHPSAKAVTDVAVAHGRDQNPNRMVVHYIQPHYPYYAAATSKGRSELHDWERFPFPRLRSGDVSMEEVWETYLTELRSVVQSVEVLLNNYDAEKAVVTADHGEAFGEWFGYKHRSGTFHPKVRQVPWVETTARDRKTNDPDIETATTDMNRDEILDALGYV